MKLLNYISILLVIILLFLCSKEDKKKNTDLLSAFQNWFISADSSIPSEILKLSDLERDSLIKIIRQKNPIKGKGILTLRDSCGKEYIVGFSTPKNFRYDTLYPCLIYLHGGVSTEFSTKGEKAYEMFEFLKDSMDIFLVSPSADRYTPWWSSVGISRILQTLRYMTLYYPINPNKVFIAGVSDGATGCYVVANTIPSNFAGFIAVSGFGGMLSYLGIKLIPENLMQRPIYNINAGKDRLYPIKEVTKFLDFLEEKGVNILRKIYPDEEHGFEYRDKEAGEICKIIREWSKPENLATYALIPQNFPYSFDHILSVKKKNKEVGEAFVNGYCEDNNYYIKEDGLKEILLVFEDNSLCIDNILKYPEKKKVKIKILNSKEINLRLLKYLCTPYFIKKFKVVNINF